MRGSTDRQTEESSQLSGGGGEIRAVIGRERERGGEMVMRGGGEEEAGMREREGRWLTHSCVHI